MQIKKYMIITADHFGGAQDGRSRANLTPATSGQSFTIAQDDREY